MKLQRFLILSLYLVLCAVFGGHVARMRDERLIKIVIDKCERKGLLGISRRRWKHIINMDLEVGNECAKSAETLFIFFYIFFGTPL
jgi:hypothetical protein